MIKYTAIDLFSGCGGLSLGLKRAGFEVLAAVEKDSLAVTTYRINHPQTIIIERDIILVHGNELRDLIGIGKSTLDLLSGCPPCQGFSRIKRKNKQECDDPRNDMVLEFLRLAKELQPRIVLLENVPHLQNDKRFLLMTNELKLLGYYCDWSVLDAADFNVPQRRKRLIFMASKLGPLMVPKGNGFRKTVRSCIGSLESPRRSNDILHRMHLNSTPRIKEMIKKIPKNGGSRTDLGRRAQLPCHKRIQGFKDVYGRMRWDDVAPTLTGSCFNPSKGRFLHPRQNRPISLREAALLQTFPRKYFFPAEAGISAVARLIGDALPPAFGEAQGRHLIAHIDSASH